MPQLPWASVKMMETCVAQVHVPNWTWAAGHAPKEDNPCAHMGGTAAAH